jgi:hypothetical protein
MRGCSRRRLYSFRVADFPPGDDICGVLEEHVRRCFEDLVVEFDTDGAGLLEDEGNEHFRVLRIAPPNRSGIWTYVSVGGWAQTAESEYGLEFAICTPAPTPRAALLLAVSAHYHRALTLGVGHTVPIGEAWMPGSLCDHFLISVPYIFGPELHACHVGDRHVEFVWLIPITPQERAFKVAHGLEELESRFEDAGMEYWQIDRPSVV